MCEYCEYKKSILELKNNIQLSAWFGGWDAKDYKITQSEAEKHLYTKCLFIDRCYL